MFKVEKCQDTLGKYNVPLASNQIAYSLIGRNNGSQDTVDKCAELGVKVLAYYPFAMVSSTILKKCNCHSLDIHFLIPNQNIYILHNHQGLLTGKYSSSVESLSDTMLTSLTSSQKTKLELKDLQQYAKRMESLLLKMEQLANEKEKTIAQVALNYITCKGAIPIPGARTVDQVKDNIGAMGWKLSDSEVETLEMEADLLGFAFEGAGFKRTSEKVSDGDKYSLLNLLFPFSIQLLL